MPKQLLSLGEDEVAENVAMLRNMADRITRKSTTRELYCKS